MIVRSALRLGICLGSVAGIVFVYTYATPARPGVVALTLLLPILLISAAWGLRYALFQCLISAVAYQYFFLFVFPPPTPRSSAGRGSGCR